MKTYAIVMHLATDIKQWLDTGRYAGSFFSSAQQAMDVPQGLLPAEIYRRSISLKHTSERYICLTRILQKKWRRYTFHLSTPL